MKALKKGVLFTLLALVGLYGCYKVTYPTYANRFRLTMAFNIDGQTYAGSSVLRTGLCIGAKDIQRALFQLRPRATVFIDLGKHGVVIAALQNWPGPRLVSVNDSELPIRAFSTPQHEISVPEVPGMTGRRDLASDSLPRLVWLSNVTDEKSARAFAVGDLTELFGPTARLEAAIHRNNQ